MQISWDGPKPVAGVVVIPPDVVLCTYSWCGDVFKDVQAFLHPFVGVAYPMCETKTIELLLGIIIERKKE